MEVSPRFVVGCCTALLDRPVFARLNRLQVVAQTVRPQFHAMVASGRDFDRHFIDDLIDDTAFLTSVREPITTLAAYTLAMQQLHARGVNLFLCLDHDCVYKCGYIQAICSFVKSAALDPDEGLFCLNLVDQHWITLYDDARADIEAKPFRRGFGLSSHESDQMVVGAPPTFVFGREAAEIVIDRFEKGKHPETIFPDMFWRQALLDAGIRITQVRTPRPVFAYVRHSNNLCWGGQSVRSPQQILTNGHGNGQGYGVVVPTHPEKLARAAAPAGREAPDVSIVIPTYNEGKWLQRTVHSIVQARSHLRFEIVVVNDGCTDGSVAAVRGTKGLRVVDTGGEQLGLVIAKNTGAKSACGRYLCFVDSHVLVHDYWIDYLRETCDDYPDGALVTGNLPDTTLLSAPTGWDQNQYGYMIRNCMLGTGWHHYGRAYSSQPYLAPLTPGGLMFTRKLHFARLGGFDSVLRKWGAEDIQISLQNYCMGGENVVDPRVVVYHYYKNSSNKKRSFAVSNAQHGFNCLHVAATYFPYDYYAKVRQAMGQKGAGADIVAEIESEEHLARVQQKWPEFVRGFDTWVVQFATELRKFLRDAEQRCTDESSPEAAIVSRQLASAEHI